MHDYISRLRVLLSELRDRRVFRITAVYAAAAFAVIQGADVMLPRLGLPDWTVTFVVVLAVLGLPLAAALAWAFERTPEGLRRTPPGPSRDAEDRPVKPVMRRDRLLRPAGLVAAVVVPVLAGAWWMTRENATVDAGSIAVMRFRVGGTEAGLSYLDEGMIDLLSARLSEDPATTVVSPSVVVRALGDAGGDMTDEAAAAIARRLGAGRALMGEVVGREEQLTLSARFVDTGTAAATVSESVSGPADSLPRLVDRLAVRLLARDARIAVVHGGSFENTPLASLRAYLEGMALHRRGRFDDATQAFAQALAIDSTFALAGLAFESSWRWAYGPVAERDRVRALTWQNRDRLGARDRVHLEAVYGPGYPEPSTIADHLAALQRAVQILPERGEVWYELGDLLFHYGSRTDLAGSRDQSRRALEQAVALAGDIVEAELHLLDLASVAGDTARVRSLANRIISRDSGSISAAYALGTLAVTFDAPELWATARRHRPDADQVARAALRRRGAAANALEYARFAWREGRTEAEREYAGNAEFFLLANGGRPSEALAADARVHALRPQDRNARRERLQVVVWVGVMWDGDTTVARRARNELRAILDEDLANYTPDAPVQHYHLCTIGIADLLEGRTDWAEPAAAHLRRQLEEVNDVGSRTHGRLCAMGLEAGIAAVRGAPDADRRTARLEEALRLGSPGSSRMSQTMNFLAAYLHERSGRDSLAATAWRRMREDVPNALSTSLREEARLAERAGDRARARRLYAEYLALRLDPEPGVLPIDERIRARLASLGEGQRQAP